MSRLRFLIFSAVLVGMALASFFLTTKKTVANACGVDSLTESYDQNAQIAIYEGQQVQIPKLAYDDSGLKVLGENTSDKWIEVSLGEQKVRAWQGDNLYLESLISTGLPWTPTPTGEFKIWTKVRSTRMHGGEGRYAYDLPNVPYVMFIENRQVPGFKGYSLHGTYWHNDFGKVHSHGCINLPTPIAQKLFYWASAATNTDQGTKIVIHN